MRPCDRLLHAVTMPAAIGTKIFLLIGVASLLHAKAIGTPLNFVPTFLASFCLYDSTYYHVPEQTATANIGPNTLRAFRNLVTCLLSVNPAPVGRAALPAQAHSRAKRVRGPATQQRVEEAHRASLIRLAESAVQAQT